MYSPAGTANPPSQGRRGEAPAPTHHLARLHLARFTHRQIPAPQREATRLSLQTPARGSPDQDCSRDCGGFAAGSRSGEEQHMTMDDQAPTIVQSALTTITTLAELGQAAEYSARNLYHL